MIISITLLLPVLSFDPPENIRGMFSGGSKDSIGQKRVKVKIYYKKRLY